MANSYTDADVNQILNNPGIFYFRQKGSSGSYTKSVFTNGSSFAYTPEQFTQAFDDTGDVYDAIAAETGEITFGFGKPYDIDFMSSLSGGLFTKSTTAGGSITAEDLVISGGWVNKEQYELKLEDSDGVFYIADGEPALTSVTASTAGVLAANDDYTIHPDSSTYSGYSISFNTAGSAGVTTSEDITIVFNSPDVVGETSMTGGGKKNYDAIEGYFESALKDGTPAYVYFYKGYYNGNLNLTFGTENSPEAAVTDVTISLKLDTTRAAGDQMFKIVKGT